MPCQLSYAISLWASAPSMPGHQTSTSTICPQVFLCMLQCRVPPPGMNAPIKKIQTATAASSQVFPCHRTPDSCSLAIALDGCANHHRHSLPRLASEKGTREPGWRWAGLGRGNGPAPHGAPETCRAPLQERGAPHGKAAPGAATSGAKRRVGARRR